ncbi:hypothetical protein KKF91_22200, partial [Myxococcota bacterium]|nr:hypothetical protein [Myxococcota bacterium]
MVERRQGQSTRPQHASVTPALSQTVNVLGERLGQAIQHQLGPADFERVEALRARCKAHYEQADPAHRREACAMIAQMSTADLKRVVQSYTAYFHLINKAEQNEIMRINAAREAASSLEAPKRESIAEAIKLFKDKGLALEEVLSMLHQLDIQ